jgi:hypothetical protein
MQGLRLLRQLVRMASATGSVSRALRTDSLMRAAALPVGAAMAITSGRSASMASMASKRTTVVVLPVPGPPDTTSSLACSQCCGLLLPVRLQA